MIAKASYLSMISPGIVKLQTTKKINTMHNNGDQFNFITDKINQIKIALFKSEINSELLLPNNVIQVLKADEDGYIWFFTSCNGKQAKSINRTFYSYLDFYKKGADCSLRVNGPAFIVEDENDAFISISNYSKSVAGSLVLIKMKIMQAEYFEGQLAQKVSWKNRIFSTINNLFFESDHKIYDFA